MVLYLDKRSHSAVRNAASITVMILMVTKRDLNTIIAFGNSLQHLMFATLKGICVNLGYLHGKYVNYIVTLFVYMKD